MDGRGGGGMLELRGKEGSLHSTRPGKEERGKGHAGEGKGPWQRSQPAFPLLERGFKNMERANWKEL